MALRKCYMIRVCSMSRLLTHVPGTYYLEPKTTDDVFRFFFDSMYVCIRYVCVVFVFFPYILDIKFVGRTTSRGHTGGRSHRISHPPSFCGECLYFSREKDSAIPFPRRP